MIMKKIVIRNDEELLFQILSHHLFNIVVDLFLE